jgi:hypothetical protein
MLGPVVFWARIVSTILAQSPAWTWNRVAHPRLLAALQSSRIRSARCSGTLCRAIWPTEGSRFDIRQGQEIFPLPKNLHSVYATPPPASCSLGTLYSYFRGKAAGACSWPLPTLWCLGLEWVVLCFCSVICSRGLVLNLLKPSGNFTYDQV